MSLQLLILALVAFCVGTTEFIIAGILPQVASDLAVSIPTAGYLISGYALGVAIGGPIVAILATRFERKTTLLVLMAVFIVGNALCALAPSYNWLMVARVVISFTHGALVGFATVMATTLVSEDKRARAISLILAGLLISNIVGVPIGTAIGNAFGWRMTFWAIAALGFASAIGTALMLRQTERSDVARPSLRSELIVLGRQEVYLSLAMIATASVAHFSLFTYVAPLLIDVVGVPSVSLPWLLSLLGVGSLIGILAGGRLADWKLMPSIIGIFVVEVVVYLALTFAIHNVIFASVAIFIWSVTGLALAAAPLQARVLKGARDAPNLVSTVISTAFNVGIASGAALGAAALTRGAGYGDLPWLGLAAVVPTLFLALLAQTLDRRKAPAITAA